MLTETSSTGMEFDQVAELVASLVSQGFLVEESGRRTRNSQGKIKFPESISTPEYIGLLVKLFDTYQVVGHHVSMSVLIGTTVILTV